MKWISVEDRLPEKKGRYLCYIKSFEDECGWYNQIEIVLFDKVIKETVYENDKIIFILSADMSFKIDTDGYTSHKVIYWMSLPEPPMAKC